MNTNVERAFDPVGMRGFDRVQLTSNASRGCCSGLVKKGSKSKYLATASLLSPSLLRQ